MEVKQMAVRKIRLLLALLVAMLATASQSEAAPQYVKKCTYKVQVKYWYFDSTSYYWETVYQSTNKAAAQSVYNNLVNAKAQGHLNQAAPHPYNRKYMAVDVRWRENCKWVFVGQLPSSNQSPSTPSRAQSGQGNLSLQPSLQLGGGAIQQALQLRMRNKSRTAQSNDKK